MKRRKFLKTSGALVAVGCTCGGMLNSCTMLSGVSNTPAAPADSYQILSDKLIINPAKIPSLNEKIASVKFEVEKEDGEMLKLLVSKVSADNFIVVENACTHGQRELEYKPDEQIIQCTSFGHSQYSVEGKVLKGPAPKDLKVFSPEFENGHIVIDLQS